MEIIILNFISLELNRIPSNRVTFFEERYNLEQGLHPAIMISIDIAFYLQG